MYMVIDDTRQEVHALCVDGFIARCSRCFACFPEDLKSIFDKKDDGSSTFTPSEPETITLKKGEKKVAAIKITYTASLSGTELKYIQVISYDNAYFYIMTFTTTPDGYTKNIDDFNSVIANFTFDN